MRMKPFNESILQKYADLLIKFALNSGDGIKKGEIVWIMVPLCAWEFAPYLRRSVLEAGGNPLFGLTWDDQRGRDFYEYGSDEQVGFAPDLYFDGLVNQIDHVVRILAEDDKYRLKGLDPQKVMKGQMALSHFRTRYRDKENQGKLTWVLASYATVAEAKDVGMSLEEYWDQIIKACYLDSEDPVAKYKEIVAEQHRIIAELNAMKIQKVHIESEHVDLWVSIGSNRQWMGGRGRNIPSFEIFTSPDWRGTNGRIRFDVPLYRYGSRISGAEVEFKDGIVVSAYAEEGDDLFKAMIAVDNANKLGEFSLTDHRMSRIDRFMGQTLYDENFGGRYGNTHVAFGSSYRDAYVGDVANTTEAQWVEMGFNESPEHTDLFSIEDRNVTAYLEDGSERVVYEDGEFRI